MSDGSQLCLFGAAPDTGNMGVSALCYSIVRGLGRHLRPVLWTVYDHQRGLRPDAVIAPEEGIAVWRCGAIFSRRVYRPESLWHMLLRGRLGLPGPDGLDRIRLADAVMTAGGGDSFSDLYGEHRFHTITMPLKITLEQQRRLIFLPQTYGPFREDKHRKEASEIVRRAAMAWARDAHSFAMLQQLLGADYDPAIHRLGVDMAFGLDAHLPTDLPRRLRVWMEEDAPLVGLNVSGLMMDGSRAADYGFRGSYPDIVRGLALRLLEETDARVVFVPHVLTKPGHYESDAEACIRVRETLPESLRDRTLVLPAAYDPTELKGVIARCDWFCGTRMHSTIAALSSGVPTAAVAYSDKTAGVFADCDMRHRVADPRTHETEEVIEQLWAGYLARSDDKPRLTAALGGVMETHRAQLSAIADTIRRRAAA